MLQERVVGYLHQGELEYEVDCITCTDYNFPGFIGANKSDPYASFSDSEGGRHVAIRTDSEFNNPQFCDTCGFELMIIYIRCVDCWRPPSECVCTHCPERLCANLGNG